MREHERNAMRVAAFLEEQAVVERVFYPGLSSHPQYGLIGRQMTGAGGLISFEVQGGADMVNKIMKKTALCYISQSFGGVESIIEHPKTMSHASMSAEAQAEAGITDGLIRLSVGLEDGEDLVQDLARAIQG
jgi:cystathionine beta-lyase/cystathionine gamma-synthase